MSIKEGNMENIRGLLKKRKASSHKGDYGRVGIIAGSIGMAGAVNLTSRAALRTGSGLVYSIVPESLELILSIKLTEAIIKPIGDKNIGYFTKDSLEQILKATKNMDALALGPGLGIDEERIYLVGELIKNINIPLVIDADGLNCLSKNINILKEVNYPII
ncbi:MAG TPA: ADP/ATP-dependent (S)-NAD(P)H-hydrate dehydratase, partial [Tissierellaceae bacterium]|nr:ADP/ATP-dependent (S)-NAD(P)H-hydrate dehydratase [Tissierellaceae bacterium]